MSKFFICAGHDTPDQDPGAVSAYGKEADFAIASVNKAIELLKSQDLKGRELVLVPHELNLRESVSWINARTTDEYHDLCMEVHLNSNAGAPGTGTETYYGLKALADEVNQEVVGVLGLRNRGVKDGNMFYFNNSTKPGSCLVELGFVNSGDDVKAINDRGGLALAKAVVRACGGTWKEPVAPVTPIVKLFYKVYGPDNAQLGAYSLLSNAQNKLEGAPYGSYIKDPAGNVLIVKVEPPKPPVVTPPVTPPVEVPPVVEPPVVVTPPAQETALEWVLRIWKIVTDFLASWKRNK